VDKIYKRVSEIDAKIHDVKLTYDAWKTLFLVTEETSLQQIADILQEPGDKTEEYIAHLLEKGLIEELVTEEPAVTEEVQPPVLVEEEVPEEIAEETPEPEPVVEEAPVISELQEEEATQETQLIEEEAEELIEEPAIEKPEIVTEPVEEEAIADILQEIEEEPVEEVAVEEEISTEEENEKIEINIPDEAALDTETLDVENTEEPAVEEPAAVPDIPEIHEQKPTASGEKVILVIDDSIVIRKMVEIALENEDLDVQTAVSGKDGMDKIDQLNPSLIILDLMLPDINGIDILKTVKAARNIPVIMLSGKDSPQMVENAKNAGADAFLPKPFKDDELKEQIKTLLEA